MVGNKKRAEQESAVQFGDVLAAAAAELQRAYERGLRLEAAILQLLARNSAGVADMNELQHLDLVLQHVNAVGDFLAALARGADDPAILAEALERVKLSDVRARLSGAEAAPTEDGDLQML